VITFRPLKKSDIKIIVLMMQEFYAIDNYPMQPETTKILLERFIADKNLGQCWLISDAEITIGYVILTYIFSFEYQGRIAFLDELYLNENARGKGIGKDVLNLVNSHAIQNNLKMIYLEIESHNEVAKKLYFSNDFVVHHRQILKRTIKS
jgi:ribosomal protein S18 acetylase RimI-like enzyme